MGGEICMDAVDVRLEILTSKLVEYAGASPHPFVRYTPYCTNRRHELNAFTDEPVEGD